MTTPSREDLVEEVEQPPVSPRPQTPCEAMPDDQCDAVPDCRTCPAWTPPRMGQRA